MRANSAAGSMLLSGAGGSPGSSPPNQYSVKGRLPQFGQVIRSAIALEPTRLTGPARVRARAELPGLFVPPPLLERPHMEVVRGQRLQLGPQPHKIAQHACRNPVL